MDLDETNLPDLSFLSEIEKQKIIEVLRRDEHLRKKQSEKYLKLKQEIDLIESRSIDIPSEHVESANVCVRCRQTFGYFFNTGEKCPQCGYKVCQKCKINQNENGFLFKSNRELTNLWLCILCHKYNQYLVQTGDWIYNSSPKINLSQTNNQNSLFKKNASRQRSSSSTTTIRQSNLNGSQIIKLSLFPNKKDEILQEQEELDFKRSTLSRQYSLLKSHNSSNDINGHNQDSESLTPISKSSINVNNNQQQTSSFLNLNPKKALNSLLKFTDISSNIQKSSPNLIGDDFESVTSSELDGLSRRSSTIVQSSNSIIINNQAKLVQKSVESIENSSNPKQKYFYNNSELNNTNNSSSTIQNESASNETKLKPSNSTISFKSKQQEHDAEMSQIDELFENGRQSLRLSKLNPINIEQTIQTSKERTLSAPTNNGQTVNNIIKQEPVIDPVEEYIQKQLEQEKLDINLIKPIEKSNHWSLQRKPKKNVNRTASIKSINENYHYDNNIQVKGRICVNLDYERKTSNLSVTISACENLASVNHKKETCNSYVKVYLLSNLVSNDKDKSNKRKTSVVKNTCNPVFEQTLRYTVSYSDLFNHYLWISVWHKDTFGRSKFLGEVKIELETEQLNSANKWYDLGQ